MIYRIINIRKFARKNDQNAIFIKYVINYLQSTLRFFYCIKCTKYI